MNGSFVFVFVGCFGLQENVFRGDFDLDDFGVDAGDSNLESKFLSLFVKLDDTGADGIIPIRTLAPNISTMTRPATRWSVRAAVPCTGWGTWLMFVW